MPLLSPWPTSTRVGLIVIENLPAATDGPAANASDPPASDTRRHDTSNRQYLHMYLMVDLRAQCSVRLQGRGDVVDRGGVGVRVHGRNRHPVVVAEAVPVGRGAAVLRVDR